MGHLPYQLVSRISEPSTVSPEVNGVCLVCFGGPVIPSQMKVWKFHFICPNMFFWAQNSRRILSISPNPLSTVQPKIPTYQNDALEKLYLLGTFWTLFWKYLLIDFRGIYSPILSYLGLPSTKKWLLGGMSLLRNDQPRFNNYFLIGGWATRLK